jgi:hypothetical protein
MYKIIWKYYIKLPAGYVYKVIWNKWILCSNLGLIPKISHYVYGNIKIISKIQAISGPKQFVKGYLGTH